MREYLVDFWKEFEYPAEDAAYLLTVYDQVQANEETAKAWDEIVECYDKDIRTPWESLLERTAPIAEALHIHLYTIHLLLAQALSRRLRQEYAAQGVEDEIFCNSMLDLRYKLEECKLVKGIIGSFVGSWFSRFFYLTRFAIGRLQFEIISFGDHYQKGDLCLTPESPVINVHIPRTGTPLDVESCDRAFAQAAAFFRRRGEIGDPCVFYCSSWLLSPENRTILSPKSNVYRFMERFDVFRTVPVWDGRNLWRLFDTDEKNPDRLPADTSMRRAYIQYLKSGGLLGSGKGVYLFKD